MMSSTETNFSSFEEVIKFRTCCPICNGKINFEPAVGMKFQQLQFDYDHYTLQDNSIGITLKVDLTDKKILQISSESLFGTYYTGLKFKCFDCAEYYFFIKLEFDIGNNILTNISLNSETIYWFRDDKSIKIHISYSYKEITVTTDIKNIHKGTFKLPLIELDVSDRSKMMEVIGKYATFL